jgi:hypothetical protein
MLGAALNPGDRRAMTFPFHLFPPYMLQGLSPGLIDAYHQCLSLPQVAAARDRGETLVEIEVDLDAARRVGARDLRALPAFVKR